MKKLIFIVISYLALDGFILPPLFSAKSDAAVLAGTGILGLSMIGVVKTIWEFFHHKEIRTHLDLQ